MTAVAADHSNNVEWLSEELWSVYLPVPRMVKTGWSFLTFARFMKNISLIRQYLQV